MDNDTDHSIPSPTLTTNPDHTIQPRHVCVYSRDENNSGDDYQAPHSLGKCCVDANIASGEPSMTGEPEHKPSASCPDPTNQPDVSGFDDNSRVQFGFSNTTDNNGFGGLLEDGDNEGDLESGAPGGSGPKSSHHTSTCGHWTMVEIEDTDDTKATIESTIINMSRKYNQVYEDCCSLILGRLVTRQCHKNPTNGW